MVSMAEFMASLAVGFAQLVIGLLLALLSAYVGLKMFDRITKGISEMKELKKGNVAVGILMGAVIISIANVVQHGVISLTASMLPGMGFYPILAAFAIGIVNLLLGLVVAVVAIYLAIYLLDRITPEFDEWKEVANGNVAVAILMSAVLFAVSFVVQAGIAGLARTLDARVIASVFGA
ncbi:DUF350 domain-containing protein [Candidatus Micrarchaeota archaeon]|nr:DUF350 domain-containing protein [Candidatus Micrarchaeota archaeon]